MTRVTIHAAKTNLSKLLARVEAGEEILIVRGQSKEPIARLVPPRRERKIPTAGWLKGQMEVPDDSAFAPMTDDELREWGLL